MNDPTSSQAYGQKNASKSISPTPSQEFEQVENNQDIGDINFSPPPQTKNMIDQGQALVLANPRKFDSDSSESDFVDASQQHNIEDEVSGDQDSSLNKDLVVTSSSHGIPPSPKVNDVNFLKQSWANLAKLEQDKDKEIHIEDEIEEFDTPFQQVVPKHKKKKTKSWLNQVETIKSRKRWILVPSNDLPILEHQSYSQCLFQIGTKKVML